MFPAPGKMLNTKSVTPGIVDCKDDVAPLIDAYSVALKNLTSLTEFGQEVNLPDTLPNTP